MEKLDNANGHQMKPFSADCDIPLITHGLLLLLRSLCVRLYILMMEGIVNTNRPQFDRGVLCLSFGTSLALIQLSKHENQAKIQRSKSAAHSSRIVYIAITHMRYFLQMKDREKPTKIILSLLKH